MKNDKQQKPNSGSFINVNSRKGKGRKKQEE